MELSREMMSSFREVGDVVLILTFLLVSGADTSWWCLASQTKRQSHSQTPISRVVERKREDLGKKTVIVDYIQYSSFCNLSLFLLSFTDET